MLPTYFRCCRYVLVHINMFLLFSQKAFNSYEKIRLHELCAYESITSYNWLTNMLCKIFIIIIFPCFFIEATLASSSNSDLCISEKRSWFSLEDTLTINPFLNSVVVSQNDDPAELPLYENSSECSDECIVDKTSDWQETLWGTPARNHIYVGMWSYHIKPGDDQDWNNQLLGLAYNGYFGCTFINTHSDRAWVLAVQRSCLQRRYGVLDVDLGYRLGVLYGYKKYLKICGESIFPLFQVITDIEYKNFGIELAWAGVVLTAGFFYRF